MEYRPSVGNKNSHVEISQLLSSTKSYTSGYAASSIRGYMGGYAASSIRGYTCGYMLPQVSEVMWVAISYLRPPSHNYQRLCWWLNLLLPLSDRYICQVPEAIRMAISFVTAPSRKTSSK